MSHEYGGQDSHRHSEEYGPRSDIQASYNHRKDSKYLVLGPPHLAGQELAKSNFFHCGDAIRKKE